MTRTRAIVLLFIVVIGTAAALLPMTRDQLLWWWAESHDHAADFMNYLAVWPNGRHAVEARLRYNQRRWIETEKEMIHQAYQEASHSSPDADAEYRREKRMRRDSFFWKAATSANTLQSYHDYLRQFPKGQFVRQARARIDALIHDPQASAPVNSPLPQ